MVYGKLIASIVGFAVLTLRQFAGIDLGDEFTNKATDLIIMAATAAGIWAVPNKNTTGLLLALLFIPLLSGCALVKTTRCAEITAYGLAVNEPVTGTFINLGYLKYKRVAAPEDKDTVACPEGFFGEVALPTSP